MKEPRTRPVCGTRRGYRKHADYGEHACDPCFQANSRGAMAAKISGYRQDRIQLPVTSVGLWFLKLELTDPKYFQQVRDELGDEVVNACMNRARNDV